MGFKHELKAATIDGFKGIFTSRKMLVMFLLGYSSGLPILLILSSLSLWYHDVGISTANIGWLGLVGLPYTIKYLWSPVIDRLSFGFLGRRRSWILLMQIMLILSVLFLSFFSPKNSPFLVAGIAIMIAFFSATQDIAINAYQTEVLDESERALGSSVGVLGYRVGMLVTGALLLIIVQYVGNRWQVGITAIIPFFILAMTGTFLAKESKLNYTPKSFKDAIIMPFHDFFTRKGMMIAITVLLVVIFYKFSDAITTSLNTVFFSELGFSKMQIAGAYKTVALLSTLLGIVVGGMLAKEFGLFRTFLAFSVLMAVANLMYMLLAVVGHNYYLMVTSVAVEYFVGAMGTAALLAMLLSLVNKSFAATQYAILSSIDSIGRTFASPFAGQVQEHWGWAMLFFISFIIGIIISIFIWLSKKRIMSLANLTG